MTSLYPSSPTNDPILKEGLKRINILGSVQKSRWSEKIKEFEIRLLKKEKGNIQEPDNIAHSQLTTLAGVREKIQLKGEGSGYNSAFIYSQRLNGIPSLVWMA